MKTIRPLTVAAVLLLVGTTLPAQEQLPSENNTPQDDSWTKTLKDGSERGTLHDAFQKVRGDSGKWNDEPQLLHAPPIDRKPSELSLDDWADVLQRARNRTLTGSDDNWLLFKTRQLDDNDRVWIERIARRGNQFTVVLSEAVWQGSYSKTFTYYSVFGVNLGRLAPGDYKVTWIVEPLVFLEFEGSGRPVDERRNEIWSKDARPAEKKKVALSMTFTVAAVSQRSDSDG